MAAAVRGILQPNPSCPFPEGCDNRAHTIALLRRQQAALDPVAAPMRLQQVAEIERALQAKRAQHAAEVARMMTATT